MNIVRKLESLFEKHIEGFFNKKFTSGLQPVEIAKQLCRLMETERSVSVSTIYVPNQYKVLLGKADHEHLASYAGAICQEIAAYLTQEAGRRGYTLVRDVEVSIGLEVSAPAGSPLFSCSFSHPVPEQEKAGNISDTLQPNLHFAAKRYQSPRAESFAQQAEETGFSDTRVFAKASVSNNNLHKAAQSAVLTVTEGNDQGRKISLCGNRINIGRRETNELPLTDLNTSRLHAYLLVEAGNYSVHDAKSLNGTYVNGQRVTRKVLKNMDKIKVGNTVLLFEVK